MAVTQKSWNTACICTKLCCYIPEDIICHSQCHDKLQSYSWKGQHIHNCNLVVFQFFIVWEVDTLRIWCHLLGIIWRVILYTGGVFNGIVYRDNAVGILSVHLTNTFSCISLLFLSIANCSHMQLNVAEF